MRIKYCFVRKNLKYSIRDIKLDRGTSDVKSRVDVTGKIASRIPLAQSELFGITAFRCNKNHQVLTKVKLSH